MAISLISNDERAHRRFMPTLSRFVLACLLIAAVSYGAIYALANFFQPTQREITVRVPIDRLTRD